MIKEKTIAWVVRNGICTGCATCFSLCHRSAINLIEDNAKGIYLPVINESNCNQCGIYFKGSLGY